MTLRGLWLMIRDIIATFKLAGDLAAGCPAGRTSFVRSRVGDPSAFGVGIPSALAHSLGSPLGASSLLGNPPRLAGSIISLIIRQSPHNVPLQLPSDHAATLPNRRRRRSRGSDFFSSRLPFVSFLFTNRVSRNVQRDFL